MNARAVRRLGSNVVHFAVYGDELRRPATHLGAPFTHVQGPLAALCGAVLRGDITEMRQWRTECRPCRHLQGDDDGVVG